MSTVQTTSIKHNASTSNNITLDSGGNVGVGTTPVNVAGYTFLTTLNNTTGAVVQTRSGSVDMRLQADTAGAGYLGAISNHPVIFWTNSLERMRITSAGDVGIGTSSPLTRFTVSGGYITQTDGTVRTYLGADGSGGSLIGTQTNQYFRFITNDVERMRIVAGGNVGIGTASPEQLLHVNGVGRFDGNIQSSLSPFVYSWQGGTSAQVRSGFLLDGSGQTLQFFTGTNERLRIDSSGNVGVGTSSPVTRLDVTGIATIRNNSASWNTTPNTNYGLNIQAASTGVCHITSYSSGGSTEIAFATNNGGAAAVERMRIDTNGNVGIGTAAPGSYGLLTLQRNSTSAPPYVVLQNVGPNAIHTDTYTSAGVLFSAFRDIANPAYIAGITVERTSGSAGASSQGALVFRTTAVPTGSLPTERARINSGGQLFTTIDGTSSVMADYGCRAWVNFNGTGTVAIRGSGNVSSITDGGTGLYTVNFATAMPDANYSAVKSENYWSIGDIFNFNVNNLTLRVYESISPGVTRDTEVICVAVFR